MSIATSQQISKWYELYKAIDVTFTKEIIKATNLDTRGVYLKCVGEQWPCVIYSSSFSGAKIVASSKAALMERIKHANGMVSLRLSFRLVDKLDPLSFFIGAKVAGFSPYSRGGGDLQFASLAYTQQPPDDYIEIMGRLLEANINSTRRREERILLTPDSMRRMCVVTKDSIVYVQGVPRKCILRDLSFSGAKAIIVGLAKFLVGKDCLLRVDMDEPRETIEIKGQIVRYEEVEGRKDLTAIAIHFDEQAVPMSFKMHVNDYLGQQRPSKAEGKTEEAAAHEAASSSSANVPPTLRPAAGK
jgi:Tfp pilus assembly protein PilZ